MGLLDYFSRKPFGGTGVGGTEIVYVRVPSSGGAPVMLHQLPIILPKVETLNILLVEMDKFIDIEIIENFPIQLIKTNKKSVIVDVEINDKYRSS